MTKFIADDMESIRENMRKLGLDTKVITENPCRSVYDDLVFVEAPPGPYIYKQHTPLPYQPEDDWDYGT